MMDRILFYYAQFLEFFRIFYDFLKTWSVPRGKFTNLFHVVS